MRKGLYIVMAAMALGIAFGACSTDNPEVDDALTRGANDSTECHGITVDTAWAGDTIINF